MTTETTYTPFTVAEIAEEALRLTNCVNGNPRYYISAMMFRRAGAEAGDFYRPKYCRKYTGKLACVLAAILRAVEVASLSSGSTEHHSRDIVAGVSVDTVCQTQGFFSNFCNCKRCVCGLSSHSISLLCVKEC